MFARDRASRQVALKERLLPRGGPRGAISRPFYFALFALFSACGQIAPKTTPDVPTVQIIQEQLPVVGDNLLDLQLFRPGTGSRLLIALMEWETPAGNQRGVEHRLQVPQGRLVRYALPYRLEEAGIHRAALRLYDPERDTSIYVAKELRLFARPAWELSGDRSYYTVEDEIRFRLRRNRHGDTTISATVELRRGVEVLDRVDINMVGQEVTGAFAAYDLPEGRYWLTARWQDPVRGLDSLAVACEKFAPAAREVKIDLFSQSLLVDGEPFFPIGLYWLRAEDLGPMRRLHFNSGDYYYKLRGEEVASLMDAAAVEGMQILLELTEYARREPEPDYQAIAALVKRYRQHPALLAWYLVDEPAETKMAPASALAMYELIRELDPYHPVYLVNNRSHTYAAYSDASDILAIDVYPIPNYPITQVGAYMEQARWTSLERKPVWLIAQAFGGVEHWARSPTATELRNMVYQGLVGGAKGVLFYRYCQENERHIQPLALWREVQRLAAELAELGPVLLQEEHSLEAQLAGAEIKVAIKEYNRDFYVFAVNVAEDPQRLDLRLEGLPPMGEAEVLYGQAAPMLANGRLAAELEPLGTAVFRLQTAGI